ncbi:mitochondrial carrier [Stereum hirsutum FP-91666 SS1]|uniref:mitochondrial carrier n=1 Tax=Stereum hirsutum (strain FP-91666) TaxID=721885 RepID=UPI000440A548|nr:mitochondrial carrier [Stereum hirsutum FP-91666 SS1]EIM87725.1 mitochondrial carrier [Stereum hirsutum FP-91666 SS1]
MSDSVIHSIAGSAGGIVAMTATYPLIFLSTRAAMETKRENKTIYQAVLDVIKKEGALGMYTGLSSSLVGIAVTNGVYYFFYEYSKGAILRARKGTKALSTLESILAGLIAGSATTIISNPIWVVQTSQAVSGMNHSPTPSDPSSSSSAPVKQQRKLGTIETFLHILNTDGPAAFFRGLGPALALVANPVIQYTVFEQLKNAVVRRRKASGAGGKGNVLTDWDFFFLGALSKLVATGTTYPYIVIKSRLQANHEHAKQYRSAWHGIRTVLREEGVEGLYKGAPSKLLQSVLTAAILFAGQRRIYEITKKAISTVGTK